MSIVKSVPIDRFINGRTIKTSEVAIVNNEDFYITNGEDCIIVRGDKATTVKLQSTTTDHVVVKALTHVVILPDQGKVDEEYDEITCDRGACIEFRFCGGNWYILSSDGLKQS